MYGLTSRVVLVSNGRLLLGLYSRLYLSRTHKLHELFWLFVVHSFANTVIPYVHVCRMQMPGMIRMKSKMTQKNNAE